MNKDELREAAKNHIIGKFVHTYHKNDESIPVLELSALCDGFDAGYEAGRKAVMDRLAEAEYVIGGMHHLGTSTAAVNAATSLNQYLEKYGMNKPLPEPYTEGE